MSVIKCTDFSVVKKLEICIKATIKINFAPGRQQVDLLKDDDSNPRTGTQKNGHIVQTPASLITTQLTLPSLYSTITSISSVNLNKKLSLWVIPSNDHMR